MLSLTVSTTSKGRNRRPVGRPPGEAVVVKGKEPDFELSKHGFQVLPFVTGSIPHHSKTQNKTTTTTKTLFSLSLLICKMGVLTPVPIS